MGIKEIDVKERILTPQYFYGFKYTGPNTDKALKVVPGLIKTTFGIPSKDFAVPDFRFDISDDSSRGFYAKYEGNFKFFGGDAWTKGRIEITMQGSYATKTGEGWFKLVIIPMLTTKFVYANSLQRLFYHGWHLMFYNKQKRKYAQRVIEVTQKYISELRKVYKLVEVNK